MALFDRTDKHLARGPAVLFPTDPADGTVIDTYGFPVGRPEDMLPVTSAAAPPPGGAGAPGWQGGG